MTVDRRLHAIAVCGAASIAQTLVFIVPFVILTVAGIWLTAVLSIGRRSFRPNYSTSS